MLKMFLPLRAGIEKTDYKMETHWLSCKEKAPGTGVSKESHSESLLGREKNLWLLLSLK